MGIFDDIVSPIKNVINDIKAPIKAVEHVFGEVVTITEDIIIEFKNMIVELEDLFNASHVEALFLSPFKEAAFVAVGSIEKLVALMLSVSDITTDGVKDALIIPIRDAYGLMRRAVKGFADEIETLIQHVEDDEAELKRGLYHEFTRIKTLSSLFPTEIKILSKKIEREFKVEKGRAFEVLPEFGEFVEKEAGTAAKSVRKVGSTTRQTFENLEQSIHKRLANETAQVDFFAIAMVGLLVALIAGIFMLTQSWIVVKIFAAFLGLIALGFLVSEFVSRLF